MNRIVHHVRRVSSLVIGTPAKIANHRRSKYIFSAFAKKYGLVYFANVDTSKNDSHMVRGITLGMSKQDIHHVFGSHDGYDVMCVQRLGEYDSGHQWVVMQFDLHTAVSLPHILIGKTREIKPLFASVLGIHRDLQEHVFAQPDAHHPRFAKKFTTYAPPAHAPLVDHIVSPELTSAVMNHIHHIVIEIDGDSVYLCVEKPSTLSVSYLNKMMHYGVQFAKHIDKEMGSL
jgi:hypothetical protein